MLVEVSVGKATNGMSGNRPRRAQVHLLPVSCVVAASHRTPNATNRDEKFAVKSDGLAAFGMSFAPLAPKTSQPNAHLQSASILAPWSHSSTEHVWLTCGGDGDICGGSKVLDKRSKACGHSGPGPPPPQQRLTLLARSRTSPMQIIHCRSTLQRNKRMCTCTKSSYVASTVMCPAKQPPKVSPSSLLNSNCRDAMTLPYSHHLEASLLCYLFLFRINTEPSTQRYFKFSMHLSSRSW